MEDRWKIQALLLGGFIVLPDLIIADDLLCGRRLCNRCGLPAYRYPADHFSNPTDAASLRAITSRARLADDPVPGAMLDLERTSLRLKSFQIRERFLRVDHCELSLITVTLVNDGTWYLTLTARQDPSMLDTRQRPEFERFRRNQFRLDVNPVLLVQVQQNASGAALGKPELPHIPRQEFWVEKGETVRIQRDGSSAELAKYFELVEQVDVHFSYQ